MSDLLRLLGDAAVSPLTFWLAGLVASFRLITPAEGCLSARSAAWLARQVNGRQGGNMKRRFAVALKRYVDRTFDARPVRVFGCRLWMLSFWRCSSVSFLTFLALYWGLALIADTSQMEAQFIDTARPRLEELGDRGIVTFSPELLAKEGMMESLFWAMLLMMSLFGALANIVPDYLSFIETRNVLARMGGGFVRDVLLIGLDIVLTTAISTLGIYLISLILVTIGEGIMGDDGGGTLVEAVIAFGLVFQALEALVGALSGASFETDLERVSIHATVLSTFATSAWIWVFFSAMALLRAGVLIRPVLSVVRLLVDVDDHPFRAAWLMFAALWSVVFGLMVVF